MLGHNRLLNQAGRASRQKVKQDITETGEKSGGSWEFDDFGEEFECKT
jgi:hypothetical protein